MPSKTLLIGNGSKKLFEVFYTNPIVKNEQYSIQYMSYSYDIFPFKVQLKLLHDNKTINILTFTTLPQELQIWSYYTFNNLYKTKIDFKAKIFPK